MFKLIEGLPPDVLAIEASGTVTNADYRTILIPKAEALMAKGKIRMLYVIGGDFKRFELEALWDDSSFGFSHWHDFRRIAVVTDHEWINGSINMFKPFFPCEVRLFKLADLPVANEWIARVAAMA